MEFEPVTVSDLIAVSAELTAHCRLCGHHCPMNPALLPERFHSRAVPALEGLFRCTVCGSRETCAMPLYESQKQVSRSDAQGWILPPAE